MKSSRSLSKLLFVIILSNSLSLASDFQEEVKNGNSGTVKVIDYVKQGAIEAKRKKFVKAYGYYNTALSFLNIALSGEESGKKHAVDLTGKLTDKEIYGKTEGEHHYYNDEWSLKKRAALVANYAAEMAFYLKDYEEAAHLYGKAGEFGQDMGIAQAWYLAAACNSFRTGNYDKTLEYADLTGKMAQKCPLSDVGGGRGFEPLVKTCTNWIAILKKDGKENIAEIFNRRWKRFNRGFLQEREKQKVQETFALIPLDNNRLEGQLTRFEQKRKKLTYARNLSPSSESTPLLSDEKSSTSL